MSGPRILGPRLLRQLPRAVQTQGQVRSLHMTGAATAPRLSTLDKPVQAQFQEPSAPKTPSKQRHINTSRDLKAPNDSSTVDFAYLPINSMPPLEHEDLNVASRVPIIPDGEAIFHDSPSDMAMHNTTPASVLGPIISTMSATSTHIHAPSAMSDVHDGAEHHTTDFHDIAETLAGVRDAAQQVAIGVEREAQDQASKAKGVVKTVWTGLVADVFGAPKPTAKS